MQKSFFDRAFFDFWEDLATHNERTWFQANKARYEKAVRDPLLRFVEALGPPLHALSPHLVADPRPVGGSLMRIHRDVRFSHDKRPYKTNAGMHFSLASSRDVHAPGFYLHLEPFNCFAAGGMWHPEPPTLARIRSAIMERGAAWQEVLDSGLPLQGETLKRPPAGFDKAHPHIESLMRKDLYMSIPLEEAQVCAADFVERYVATCARMAPLVRFLAAVLDRTW